MEKGKTAVERIKGMRGAAPQVEEPEEGNSLEGITDHFSAHAYFKERYGNEVADTSTMICCVNTLLTPMERIYNAVSVAAAWNDHLGFKPDWNNPTQEKWGVVEYIEPETGKQYVEPYRIGGRNGFLDGMNILFTCPLVAFSSWGIAKEFILRAEDIEFTDPSLPQ